MLLNELATSSDTKIKKINKVLKETFGFTLVSEIPTGKLNTLYTKISDDLYDLKLDLDTVKSPVYMQKVLVLEGLRLLIKKNKLEEGLRAGPGGNAYEKVNKWLSEFVHNACEVGDDYEDAIRDAMKQYRSSKYRFEDVEVEHDLRKVTWECSPEGVDEYLRDSGQVAFAENVNEAEECDVCAKCECDPCECEKVNEADIKFPKEKDGKFMGIYPTDVWWKNDPADLMSFIYWKQGQLPPSRKSAYAKNWNNIVKQLSAKYPPPDDWVNPVETPEPTEQECDACFGRGHDLADKLEACRKCKGEGKIVESEIEEVVDRHASREWVKTIGTDDKPGYYDPEAGELGLSIEDPEEQPEAEDFFSYRGKQKRTKMKEGYVKQLRRLLEAETDQAESLIAAKSFSQELQDMIEKLGRLVNEDLPAVSVQMRDAYGSDVATGFEDQVSSTLNAVMDSLRNSKQEIDNSVTTIADGGAPSNDMDDYSDAELGGEFGDEELGLDGDVDLDLEVGDDLGDEFGGDDAVAGDFDEPLGRAKKESLKILGKKIVETQAKLARIKARS